MAELDSRLRVTPAYQPLHLPESSIWVNIDPRLIADRQTFIIVALWDETNHDFGTAMRPERGQTQELTGFVQVTPERGAEIHDLLEGCIVRVGPRHRDGTLLPDSKRLRLDVGVNDVAYFGRTAPASDVPYTSTVSRWVLGFQGGFAPGVGDSVSPGAAEYTFSEFDEVTILVQNRDTFTSWCAVLSEVSQDSLLLTTAGEVEITDQRVDVRVRVRYDARHDPYEEVALLVGSTSVNYEVISVADDVTAGRRRFQVLGLRRIQSRAV